VNSIISFRRPNIESAPAANRRALNAARAFPQLWWVLFFVVCGLPLASPAWAQSPSLVPARTVVDFVAAWSERQGRYAELQRQFDDLKTRQASERAEPYETKAEFAARQTKDLQEFIANGQAQIPEVPGGRYVLPVSVTAGPFDAQTKSWPVMVRSLVSTVRFQEQVSWPADKANIKESFSQGQALLDSGQMTGRVEFEYRGSINILAFLETKVVLVNNTKGQDVASIATGFTSQIPEPSQGRFVFNFQNNRKPYLGVSDPSQASHVKFDDTSTLGLGYFYGEQWVPLGAPPVDDKLSGVKTSGYAYEDGDDVYVLAASVHGPQGYWKNTQWTEYQLPTDLKARVRYPHVSFLRAVHGRVILAGTYEQEAAPRDQFGIEHFATRAFWVDGGTFHPLPSFIANDPKPGVYTVSISNVWADETAVIIGAEQRSELPRRVSFGYWVDDRWTEVQLGNSNQKANMRWAVKLGNDIVIGGSRYVEGQTGSGEGGFWRSGKWFPLLPPKGYVDALPTNMTAVGNDLIIEATLVTANGAQWYRDASKPHQKEDFVPGYWKNGTWTVAAFDPSPGPETVAFYHEWQ